MVVQSEVPLKWRARALSKVDALVENVSLFLRPSEHFLIAFASDMNFLDAITETPISAGLMTTLVRLSADATLSSYSD